MDEVGEVGGDVNWGGSGGVVVYIALHNVTGCTKCGRPHACLKCSGTPDGPGKTGRWDNDGRHLPFHPNTTARTMMTKTTARITSKQHAFPLALF